MGWGYPGSHDNRVRKVQVLDFLNFELSTWLDFGLELSLDNLEYLNMEMERSSSKPLPDESNMVFKSCAFLWYLLKMLCIHIYCNLFMGANLNLWLDFCLRILILFFLTFDLCQGSLEVDRPLEGPGKFSVVGVGWRDDNTVSKRALELWTFDFELWTLTWQLGWGIPAVY